MINWYLKSINNLKSFQAFNEKDYAENTHKKYIYFVLQKSILPA